MGLVRTETLYQVPQLPLYHYLLLSMPVCFERYVNLTLILIPKWSHCIKNRQSPLYTIQPIRVKK